MPHKGRDLRLMHTLEIKRNYKMEILQRCSTFLWIKADISRSHVLKKERRSAVGGLAQKRIRENGEKEKSLNKKKRPKKVKAQDIPTQPRTYVQNKKKVNTATTPQESVDHMEKLLTERVYHAEDQTTAFSEMIEEMGQRIFAYNSVKKSPQRILIENEAESLI